MGRASYVEISSLALLALAGCGDLGSTRSTQYVAVGSAGELSGLYGPCSHGASAGPVRFLSGDHYEALAPGVAHFACRDARIVLEVRVPVRLEINPVPSVFSGANVSYRASAFGAAGESLDLGGGTPMTWSFGGALQTRARPGCGDVLPICPPPSGGYARAGDPGVGEVSVRLGGLAARTTTVVRGREKA